jgi:thiol-disulfide isomerase/thioredoxin
MIRTLFVIAIVYFILIPLRSRSQSPVVIAVNVTGGEGKPLKNAYVKIVSKDFKQEIIRKDGRFIIHLPDTGVYEFWTGGVHHKSLTFPLLIEETGTVEFKILLATTPLESRLDSVFVVGDFNNFSAQAGRIKMHRLKNGKFGGTVPVNTDSLAYQLLGVQYGWSFPIEGTQAHHFTYLPEKPETPFGSTKFYSVVKTKGKTAEIIFDPDLLPASNSLPQAKFKEPGSRAAKVASISLDASRRNELFYHSYLDNIRRGGDLDAKHYDKSKDHAVYKRLIQQEKDPFLKQYLLLSYFDFLADEATPEMAKLFLEEVPAWSRVWTLYPDAYAFTWVSKALSNSGEADEYVHKLLSSQHDPLLVSSFLYFGLERSSQTGNEMLADLYYSRLVKEFPDSHSTAKAMKRYGSENRFAKGRPVPWFEAKALNNEALVYTPNNMKGKVYLMDFWATWCPPCIAELPALNNLYETFKDRSFTILSVSADEHAERIDAFRKKRWAMPWMHTILTNGLKDPFAVNFEVTNLPTQILVDEDGVILAGPADIAKEGLQAILDGHFQH